MTEVCDLSNPADADFVELIDDDLESDDLDVEEMTVPINFRLE